MAANLRPRLQLLRIALFDRFVWDEVIRMALSHGILFNECRGNTHPFRFLSSEIAGPTSPDLSAVGPIEDYAPPDGTTWNSEPSVGAFLGELAFRMKATTVVELGCYTGWTSAHLAAGLRAAGCGRLWCLDSDPKYLQSAREHLTRQGLSERIEFIRGLSTESATLAALPPSIDLLFIDTTHEYEDTKRELVAYLPRLSPHGIIAFHDSISHVGVRRALTEIMDNYDVLTFATEMGNGLSVVRRRGNK